MTDEDWTESDELDTRKPLILRIVAFVVIVGLLLYIVDLFVALVTGGF